MVSQEGLNCMELKVSPNISGHIRIATCSIGSRIANHNIAIFVSSTFHKMYNKHGGAK
jgi:hypothetical protein